MAKSPGLGRNTRGEATSGVAEAYLGVGSKWGPISGSLVSGTQVRLPVPSRTEFPPCLQPPGGSRRLPKGGEEALVWPSLVIRPFNCNYFCN